MLQRIYDQLTTSGVRILTRSGVDSETGQGRKLWEEESKQATDIATLIGDAMTTRKGREQDAGEKQHSQSLRVGSRQAAAAAGVSTDLSTDQSTTSTQLTSAATNAKIAATKQDLPIEQRQASAKKVSDTKLEEWALANDIVALCKDEPHAAA